MKRLFVACMLMSMMVLAGCGGSSPGAAVGTQGDSFAFEPTTLSLAANTPTTVTFTNESSSLQHNWVLVRGGDPVAAQVNAAAQGAPNYVPEGPDVIAASNLLNAGANQQVAVPGIEPGMYMYICTFPGHYDAGMKGTLTVQ